MNEWFDLPVELQGLLLLACLVQREKLSTIAESVELQPLSPHILRSLQDLLVFAGFCKPQHGIIEGGCISANVQFVHPAQERFLLIQHN